MEVCARCEKFIIAGKFFLRITSESAEGGKQDTGNKN